MEMTGQVEVVRRRRSGGAFSKGRGAGRGALGAGAYMEVAGGAGFDHTRACTEHVRNLPTSSTLKLYA